MSNAPVLRAIRLLPPAVFRDGLLALTWLETWLRWPLATLHMGDQIDSTLEAIDPGGRRLGLSRESRTAIKHNILYAQVADLFALMNTLESPSHRSQTLSFRGGDTLERAQREGPGTIVVGFRTGPHPAFPWALAAAAGETKFVVGSPHLVDLAERLGATFMPRASHHVKFLDAQDPRALTGCLTALNSGETVATLLELSPLPASRTAGVQFLGWNVQVPYGISYLSAMTGRPVIPAWLYRRHGARFRLSFGEPVPAPKRNTDSIQAQTQRLYSELERRVRKFPEHWIGWTLLQSNLGIELNTPHGVAIPVLS